MENLKLIVESIQKREVESADQLRHVLQQQREHFAKEVAAGTGTVAEALSTESGGVTLKRQTESAVREMSDLFESYKAQLGREVEANMARLAQSDREAAREAERGRLLAFEAERREWEASRSRAERELEERTQALERRLKDAESSALARTPQPPQPAAQATLPPAGSSLDMKAMPETEPEPELTVIEVNYHKSALILLKNFILRHFMRHRK